MIARVIFLSLLGLVLLWAIALARALRAREVDSFGVPPSGGPAVHREPRERGTPNPPRASLECAGRARPTHSRVFSAPAPGAAATTRAGAILPGPKK
jgi:hypothetical protein